MFNMQAFFDAIGDAARDSRKKYHVTLGKLIEVLAIPDPDNEVIAVYPDGTTTYVGEFTSYHGYYSDLALMPSNTPHTVAEILQSSQAALGATFEGYKGGDFEMGEDTPLWVAAYGSCGPAVVDVSFQTGFVKLILKEVD